jgi:hypothetical protein
MNNDRSGKSRWISLRLIQWRIAVCTVVILLATSASGYARRIRSVAITDDGITIDGNVVAFSTHGRGFHLSTERLMAVLGKPDRVFQNWNDYYYAWANEGICFTSLGREPASLTFNLRLPELSPFLKLNAPFRNRLSVNGIRITADTALDRLAGAGFQRRDSPELHVYSQTRSLRGRSIGVGTRDPARTDCVVISLPAADDPSWRVID